VKFYNNRFLTQLEDLEATSRLLQPSCWDLRHGAPWHSSLRRHCNAQLRAGTRLAAKWKMDQGHRDSDVFLVGITAKVQILIDFSSPGLQLPNTTHKCAFCVGETAPGPGPKRKYHRR
jgi:hypothetical protein